jgi:hypothetical protein
MSINDVQASSVLASGASLGQLLKKDVIGCLQN